MQGYVLMSGQGEDFRHDAGIGSIVAYVQLSNTKQTPCLETRQGAGAGLDQLAWATARIIKAGSRRRTGLCMSKRQREQVDQERTIDHKTKL